MQNPTDQAEAEASIPEETGSNDSPNKNRPVAVRRKAAKRTLPWDLQAGELDLMSPPPPPQAESVMLKLEYYSVNTCVRAESSYGINYLP